MPLKVAKNILEAAIGNGTVRRFRDFALVILDGEGGLAVPNDVWLPASAWATSRAPSGNRLRDRFQLLSRLDVLVTRRGTAVVSTGGAHLRLARLRDAMKREGLDLQEWNFPPKEILDQALNPEPDTQADAKADAKPDAKPVGAEDEAGVGADPGTRSGAADEPGEAAPAVDTETAGRSAKP